MMVCSWWYRWPHKKKIVLTTVVLLWVGLQTVYFYQQVKAQQAEKTLESLQPYVQRLARLQVDQRTPTSAAIPLNTLIKRSTQRHSVTLLTLTPQDGDINVILAPMPFRKFIGWLAELQREHGISVRTLQITVLPSSGHINVEALRLQRLLTY